MNNRTLFIILITVVLIIYISKKSLFFDRNYSIVEIKQKSYNFGRVKIGDTIQYFFKLKNVSTHELIINSTTVEGGNIYLYFNNRIKPNYTDSLRTTICVKNKTGPFLRHIYLLSNTEKKYDTLIVRGFVIDVR